MARATRAFFGGVLVEVRTVTHMSCAPLTGVDVIRGRHGVMDRDGSSVEVQQTRRVVLSRRQSPSLHDMILHDMISVPKNAHNFNQRTKSTTAT